MGVKQRMAQICSGYLYTSWSGRKNFFKKCQNIRKEVVTLSWPKAGNGEIITRKAVPVRCLNPNGRHQENEASFEQTLKPGGWCSDQELKKKKKITPRASLVLCDDRVRDLSLIRLIFRDMYDVPARRFPFRSVTIQSICQVESHSTEIYSRILFFRRG